MYKVEHQTYPGGTVQLYHAIIGVHTPQLAFLGVFLKIRFGDRDLISRDEFVPHYSFDSVGESVLIASAVSNRLVHNFFRESIQMVRVHTHSEV